MNCQIEKLCGDSLFQLNMAIWLSQPKPGDFSVHPIFYESGFRIHSIGPRLAIPPDIRLILNESDIKFQDSAIPDIVLSTENYSCICLMECKKNSFGIGSSTTEQANTLLVISGPTALEVLGLNQRNKSNNILAYLTQSSQIDALKKTLEELKNNLRKLNLKPGSPGCFGLGYDKNSINIHFSRDIGELMNIRNESPIKVLTIEEETDPRPLYIIPYDPSSINQHSQEEEILCRRILYERFLAHIICKVGSAQAPVDVIIPIDEILNSVTFHFFEIWEDRKVKKNFKNMLKDFMTDLQQYLGENRMLNYETSVGWVIKIQDCENHENFIKQISKFKPEKMDLDKPIPLLFDE